MYSLQNFVNETQSVSLIGGGGGKGASDHMKEPQLSINRCILSTNQIMNYFLFTKII